MTDQLIIHKIFIRFLLNSLNITDCIPIPKLSAHYYPSNLNSLKTAILLFLKQWFEQTTENHLLFQYNSNDWTPSPRFSTEPTGGEAHRQAWLPAHSLTEFREKLLTGSISLSILYTAPNLKSNYLELKYCYLRQYFQLFCVFTLESYR